jgi:hypothetical protein
MAHRADIIRKYPTQDNLVVLISFIVEKVVPDHPLSILKTII